MDAVTSTGPDLSSLLPGYTLERELGRGAMGIVFLARHESLGRHVAVKELQGALAADPATRSRFVVEAKVMASLDHPHVVPVYDFVERDDRCLLVMEQLPGGTVWDHFVADGMTMPRATAIALATCSAMQHAHDNGVLHRDIKPENLMFDGVGSLKVTDFGIARVVNGASTRATAAGSVLGTPAYMAPEQAEGHEVGPAVDVYAAATMLYEMLSGRLPFDQTDSLTAMLTQRILHDPTPLGAVAPHVPEPIAAATMRALDRAPVTRTPTAEQLGVDLARAAAAVWGPAWLDAAGITVAGNDAIEQAARTAAAAPTAEGRARATVLPGEVAAPTGQRTSDTVIGASPVPDDDETPNEPAPSAPSGAEPASPGRPTPPPSAPAPPIDDVTVKPTASDREVGRAKADEIDQLIDISEILKAPSRPIAQYAIAAALFVAGLAWALIGGGSAETEPVSAAFSGVVVNGVDVSSAAEPIDIDLNEAIIVEGLEGRQVAGIEFEQFGLPVGDAPTELASLDAPGCCAQLDPGFIGRITSGAVEATLVLDPGDGSPVQTATFDAVGTNPWFLSSAGIISMVLVLFGAASIESYLRAFRRGRGRVTTFAGLAVGGAIFGAAAAVACTIVFGTARGVVAIAGPAALCAAGAIALGLATRANRARRRAARQELRHTAIKALASSGR